MSPKDPARRVVPRVTAEGLRGDEGKLYFAHSDLITAANVALVCGRPLLLAGEPGCGKTDFAFAVARQFAEQVAEKTDRDPREYPLLECYVRSDSRASDLLYHYDAVRRFSEAQLRAERAHDVNAGEYIRLEALGRAIISDVPRVVLIDEIDKAPRDLPNDLLRPIDKHSFDIPEMPPNTVWRPPAGEQGGDQGRVELRSVMRAPCDNVRPLVIITSNEERQLPDPFLRRCVFYYIQFPARHELDDILIDRFGKDIDKRLRGHILTVFGALREAGLGKKPTTSELIDWTKALTALRPLDEVYRDLGELCDVLPPEGAGRQREMPWGRVPMLSCLVKSSDDLIKLGLIETAGAAAR